MMITSFLKENSSYKDKSAQVGYIDGKISRIIYKNYKETFEKFIDSGLYDELLSKNLIIKHQEIYKNEDYIIIQPDETFISYPWEWSFSALKDSALITLEIQKIALKYDFILKDANCFNIQFQNNAPILIDTTSFIEYKNDSLWVGYKQFCTNFLAPLLLMAYKDIRLQNLFLGDISGIDLDLTSKLLPIKTWFNFNILSNIHLHAIFSKKYANTNKKIQTNNKINKKQMICFVDSLIEMVENIKLSRQNTIWAEYYKLTNYSEESFEDKKAKILDFAKTINPKKIIDFGANTGEFSKLFKNSTVFALDFDRLAVEYNYLECKKNKIENIFPLIFDIINPFGSVGFLNEERKNFLSRIKNVDLTLALALIHHLRIANNIPFEKMVEFFGKFSKYLIIEFVPKEDSKIQQMLLNREDVFDDYTIENFEKEFSKQFEILKKENILSSKRTLYLMRKYE